MAVAKEAETDIEVVFAKRGLTEDTGGRVTVTVDILVPVTQITLVLRGVEEGTGEVVLSKGAVSANCPTAPGEEAKVEAAFVVLSGRVTVRVFVVRDIGDVVAATLLLAVTETLGAAATFEGVALELLDPSSANAPGVCELFVGLELVAAVAVGPSGDIMVFVIGAPISMVVKAKVLARKVLRSTKTARYNLELVGDMLSVLGVMIELNQRRNKIWKK